MSCFSYNGVMICRPTVKQTKKMVVTCPTCKKQRAMFGWFQDWYGWYVTCLTCGEQWQDGEMLERPFQPGWRKANVAYARKMMAKYRESAKRQE